MKTTDVKHKIGDAATQAMDTALTPVQHALDAVGDKAAPLVQEAAKKASSNRTRLVVGLAVLAAIAITLRSKTGEQ